MQGLKLLSLKKVPVNIRSGLFLQPENHDEHRQLSVKSFQTFQPGSITPKKYNTRYIHETNPGVSSTIDQLDL
jgi:hypothetical protein